MSGVEGGLGPSCPGSHVHQAVAETCSKAWGFPSRSSARPGCLLLSQEAEHPRGLQQVKLKFLAQCGGPHEGAPPPPPPGTVGGVSRRGMVRFSGSTAPKTGRLGGGNSGHKVLPPLGRHEQEDGGAWGKGGRGISASRKPRALAAAWRGAGEPRPLCQGGDTGVRGQTLGGGLQGCWFLRPRSHCWEGETGSTSFPRQGR